MGNNEEFRPALKLSALEDLRVTTKRCGQARQGQKVTCCVPLDLQTP